MITSYTYDPLNRLTRKSYNDGTAKTVKYAYDGVAPPSCSPAPPAVTDSNPKGSRTAMCDASGATAWTHDPMGRVLQENRTNNGHTLAINYTYNLDGSLATLKNISGRTITYTPGGAGRSLEAKDVANGINYVTAAHYAPFGALTGLTNGGVITTTDSYNNRLQPATLSAIASSTTVMSLSYNFHLGSGDNGNVYQITNNRDTMRSQTFTYDALNRIASAQSQATSGANCWGDSYTIDPWGNLTNKTVTKCSAEMLNAGPATVQNRLPGLVYDLAGNVVTNGSAAYTYDAENQLKTAGGVTYVYDGDGKRVNKSLGRLYWYGMTSDTMTETDGSGNLLREFVFFNGKRIARVDLPGGTVHYYFADHLGTLSVMANASGTIENDSDYYPYGTERVVTQSVSNEHYKFSGKEWDSESGLEDFGARYNASSLGRFMTPDWAAKVEPVPYAKLDNPQTLNLYAYVGNNPLSRFDPDGHCADHYKDGSCKVNVDPKTGDAGAKAGKQLEGVLNKYDKAINALGDKSKFDIKDSKGNVIGSLTGKEIKTVWNGTSFTVTNQTDFNNGGAGGGTSGTWKSHLFSGQTFSGQSNLSPAAVSAYVNAGSARDGDPFVGLSTMTFHELAHETHFGEALTQQYPVTPTLSWPRERGASSAGRGMSQAVGAPFDCAIPEGGCQ